MLYRRFEQLIDIFRDAPSAAPPDKVLPFYLYYLRQVWPMFCRAAGGRAWSAR
jgi:ATP-binding cassette, subfamily B, multidrug efflux pump